MTEKNTKFNKEYYKKKYEDEKWAREAFSLAHTQEMCNLRESNMAFDELLSRVPKSIIREAFYELKERKISENE